MRFWTTIVALMVLTLAPAHAQESTGTAAVMRIQAPPELGEQATALQEALRREVQIHKDIEPALQGGDMTIDDGLAFSDCEDITPECLDQVSALLSSTMLVFGTLTQEADGVALSLRWYGAGVGFRRQLSERFPNAESVLDASPGLARRLIQGELGRLVVQSNQAGATVLLNGQQIGLTPFEGEVAVGNHMIGLQKDGFLSTGQQEITIERDGSQELAIELFPSHLAISEDAIHPLVLVGWPMAGVGVAAVIGGVITFVLKEQEQSAFDEIFKKQASQITIDDLTKARNHAKSGHDLNSATYVLFYGGGAFALTGATLLILGYLSDGGSDVDVQATFGPDGGHIDFSWRW